MKRERLTSGGNFEKGHTQRRDIPERYQIVEVVEGRRQVERVVGHERPVGVRAGDQVEVLGQKTSVGLQKMPEKS